MIKIILEHKIIFGTMAVMWLVLGIDCICKIYDKYKNKKEDAE